MSNMNTNILILGRQKSFYIYIETARKLELAKWKQLFDVAIIIIHSYPVKNEIQALLKSTSQEALLFSFHFDLY